MVNITDGLGRVAGLLATAFGAYCNCLFQGTLGIAGFCAAAVGAIPVLYFWV